ncbi:MAG: signal peptidase I [Nitrospinae bacterium]|nr:signal peptidase I [Nitrospinota bacterium]
MSDASLATRKSEKRKRKSKSTFREYAEAIIIALLLAMFVRTFVVQAFKIPSGSMENTLLVGDHILVNKFIYWFREPNRGDIIVFRFPKDERRDFIKRVIALPGEEVMVRGGKVFINCASPNTPEKCVPLDEKYVRFKPNGPSVGFESKWGPQKVPPGHLFMLGDNRNNSQDSRFWGFLKMGEHVNHIPIRFAGYVFGLPFPCSLWSAPCWDDKIRGSAFMIYWSWNGDSGSPRWGRLASIIS